MNTIFCAKLQKQAPALQRPPYPGPLGERIFKEISQPAWDMWLSHQTMLINEYRLSALEAKDRKFLAEQMQAYLFGDESQVTQPEGYTPPAGSP